MSLAELAHQHAESQLAEAAAASKTVQEQQKMNAVLQRQTEETADGVVYGRNELQVGGQVKAEVIEAERVKTDVR